MHARPGDRDIHESFGEWNQKLANFFAAESLGRLEVYRRQDLRRPAGQLRRVVGGGGGGGGGDRVVKERLLQSISVTTTGRRSAGGVAVQEFQLRGRQEARRSRGGGGLEGPQRCGVGRKLGCDMRFRLEEKSTLRGRKEQGQLLISGADRAQAGSRYCTERELTLRACILSGSFCFRVFFFFRSCAFG